MIEGSRRSGKGGKAQLWCSRGVQNGCSCFLYPRVSLVNEDRYARQFGLRRGGGI